LEFLERGCVGIIDQQARIGRQAPAARVGRDGNDLGVKRQAEKAQQQEGDMRGFHKCIIGQKWTAFEAHAWMLAALRKICGIFVLRSS
jgi:hypothetical protein